ncbi:hypothetical protein THAOC_27441 [Thalassiosira oceanica]|uniref:Uncharacterized protein n=1 Tax=Thalassiosira oceanica TaxID=159749 RepID=K0S2V7_THAOC|nr:hypothetical protein THAOC_27441 [Thalassiosira oceanica]|eukprot:EJK53182.1 hypothetical protein THAOC_27441 [Thalassiosira oceanica]
MEENAKEAHKEYLDAKGLLTRVRLASSSAVDMMGGKVAAEELSDDEAGLEAIIAKKKKSATSSAKSRKIPFIQDVIIDMAKRGELVDGKEAYDGGIGDGRKEGPHALRSNHDAHRGALDGGRGAVLEKPGRRDTREQGGAPSHRRDYRFEMLDETERVGGPRGPHPDRSSEAQLHQSGHSCPAYLPFAQEGVQSRK